MTLGQVEVYAKAIVQMEKETLIHSAISVRAGMSDEKGFKQWMKSLENK